jgi:hypothetical protein
MLDGPAMVPAYAMNLPDHQEARPTGKVMLWKHAPSVKTNYSSRIELESADFSIGP